MIALNSPRVLRLRCCVVNVRSLNLITILILIKRFLGIEAIIRTRMQLTDALLELLVVSMNSMEAEVLVLMQAVLLMHKALQESSSALKIENMTI